MLQSFPATHFGVKIFKICNLLQRFKKFATTTYQTHVIRINVKYYKNINYKATLILGYLIFILH